MLTSVTSIPVSPDREYKYLLEACHLLYFDAVIHVSEIYLFKHLQCTFRQREAYRNCCIENGYDLGSFLCGNFKEDGTIQEIYNLCVFKMKKIERIGRCVPVDFTRFSKACRKKKHLNTLPTLLTGITCIVLPTTW